MAALQACLCLTELVPEQCTTVASMTHTCSELRSRSIASASLTYVQLRRKCVCVRSFANSGALKPGIAR